MIKAGKIAVKRIKEFFKDGISFNQETTLCGAGILKNIKTAKNLGYKVILYYVGLDSVEIAKERVRNRVKNGGHGIPEEDIERRYNKSFERLTEILPLCDIAELYDNTERIIKIARIQNGVCIEKVNDVPKWAENILT